MKKIFSLKLANELMRKGNKVVDIEINTKNPKLKVFLFEDTDKLRNDMTSITKRA